MGLFDSVYVDCPGCNQPVEFQSKADPDPYCRVFKIEDAPTDILIDILNSPEYCQKCGTWLALVDPAIPPGPPPRPAPQIVKVKPPENPRTHFQGFRWWPDDKPFTLADIES